VDKEGTTKTGFEEEVTKVKIKNKLTYEVENKETYHSRKNEKLPKLVSCQ
jgi:hypothetical protein